MTDTKNLYRVLYEPAHDIATMRTVLDTLAARGYELTSDASWYMGGQSIEINGGRLQLCDANGEIDLAPVKEFNDPAEYANAVADALDQKLGKPGES